MPTRRKNVDLGRIKRSSKRNKLSDYFTLPYVQYILIFIIWVTLLLIHKSTELRFEYFWPGWLFICSIHDSLKYQGLQYTIVFIVIVLTMDLICFFMVPVSWIYSCGSAYVWVYLLCNTDQGRCLLTLTFCCFVVCFELSYYSREARFNHSIYLFRPFAAHSIGYPVVCMGFSIKQYLEVRHRKFKKLEVQQQNHCYFRILRDAIPPSVLTDGGISSPYLSSEFPESTDYIGSRLPSDFSTQSMPWSLCFLAQLARSFWSGVGRWWCPPHSPTIANNKHCNGLTTHSPNYQSYNRNGFSSCLPLANGALPSAHTSDALGRRLDSSNTAAERFGQPRRYLDSAGWNDTHARTCANGSTVAGHNNNNHNSTINVANCGKNSGSSKTTGPANSGKANKEDLATRLENSVRRLRDEQQSRRSVDVRLRNQLTQLEHDDQSNQSSLSKLRRENELLASQVGKLTSQSRSERSNLATTEQSLEEELRLCQSLEEQLVNCKTENELNEALSGDISNKDYSNSGLCNKSHRDRSIQYSDDLNFQSDKYFQLEHIDNAHSCCRERCLLESEVARLRRIMQQQQQQQQQTDRVRSPLQAVCRPNVNNNPSTHESIMNQSRLQPSSLASTYHASSNLSSDDSKHMCKQDHCPPSPSSSSPLFEDTNAVDACSARQQQLSFLTSILQSANQEKDHLTNTLREVNWMKQELFTAYHTSVRDINDLDKTLKQRDYHILELTLKINQAEGQNATFPARTKSIISSSSSPPRDLFDNISRTDVISNGSSTDRRSFSTVSTLPETVTTDTSHSADHPFPYFATSDSRSLASVLTSSHVLSQSSQIGLKMGSVLDRFSENLTVADSHYSDSTGYPLEGYYTSSRLTGTSNGDMHNSRLNHRNEHSKQHNIYNSHCTYQPSSIKDGDVDSSVDLCDSVTPAVTKSLRMQRICSELH